MRRWWMLLLVMLLLAGQGCAEEGELRLLEPGEEICPGSAAIIDFFLPEDGEYSILILDDEGSQISAVAVGRAGVRGFNTLYWNGTWQGVPAPEGIWRMALEAGGQRAEVPVTIGRLAPCLISVSLDPDTVETGDEARIRYFATEDGTLVLQRKGSAEPLLWENISAGQGEGSFHADLEPGTYELVLTLAGENGALSEPGNVTLTVLEKTVEDPVPAAEELTEELREKAGIYFTPVHGSPREGTDGTLNYWTLPMDITDEESVWKALMAPTTVVDNGRKNAEKTQIVIRSQPSEESGGVGMVTCVSQGVHVLERGEEWSLIECYSSSFHDSPVLNWNALVQGYVPTAYLKEIQPDPEMGLVVDKLTQRLYVFREGKLLSTLLVSTGLANAKQPYNETRSGEFFLVSKVGEFSSDNMRCAMALRFNDGDLIHEVPYFLSADGRYRNYTITEPKLGSRASHGCIRVQRQMTPEGVSQKWLWNHYRKYTKILIWEDWQGRQIPYPAEDTPLWAQSGRSGYYHTSPQCYSVRNRKLTAFTYGQLEEEKFAGLKPCEHCAAPPRADVIEAVNLNYAPGGDHDPVMTEARSRCPRNLREK